MDRVKVTDVNENETRYVSNARALLGKVEVEQGGDDNETAFSYDGNKELTRIADEAGNETQYGYNAFNELEKVARANATLDDPTAQYEYDKAALNRGTPYALQSGIINIEFWSRFIRVKS